MQKRDDVYKSYGAVSGRARNDGTYTGRDVAEELFFVGEEGGKKIELYFLYTAENIITHTTYTISFSNFVK